MEKAKAATFTARYLNTKGLWYLYDPAGNWIADIIDFEYAKKIVDALNYCELDEPIPLPSEPSTHESNSD